MPRGKKRRCCRTLENETIFKPTGIPLSEMEIVELELDELEAVRLADYEGKSQIETGEIMNVSRGTVQRLLASGKKKNNGWIFTFESNKAKKYIFKLYR